MGWFGDRIKGSELAKQRHRIALGATLFCLTIGYFTFQSDRTKKIVAEFKEGGKYAESERSRKRREQFGAFNTTEIARTTREDREEALEEMREMGMDVPLSTADLPYPVPESLSQL